MGSAKQKKKYFYTWTQTIVFSINRHVCFCLVVEWLNCPTAVSKHTSSKIPHGNF